MGDLWDELELRIVEIDQQLARLQEAKALLVAAQDAEGVLRGPCKVEVSRSTVELLKQPKPKPRARSKLTEEDRVAALVDRIFFRLKDCSLVDVVAVLIEKGGRSGRSGWKEFLIIPSEMIDAPAHKGRLLVGCYDQTPDLKQLGQDVRQTIAEGTGL